jgi:hypothetical protein
MRTARLMGRIAATDRTFTFHDGEWVGKCLICGGPLRFGAETATAPTSSTSSRAHLAEAMTCAISASLIPAATARRDATGIAVGDGAASRNATSCSSDAC